MQNSNPVYQDISLYPHVRFWGKKWPVRDLDCPLLYLDLRKRLIFQLRGSSIRRKHHCSDDTLDGLATFSKNVMLGPKATSRQQAGKEQWSLGLRRDVRTLPSMDKAE